MAAPADNLGPSPCTAVAAVVAVAAAGHTLVAAAVVETIAAR